MKRLHKTIGCIAMLQACVASGVDIEITGIETHRGGNIMVMIFAEQGFPIKHQLALQVQSQKAVDEVMRFHFELTENEIAVKVLHDENENGKVTKDWTGIFPAEGLGFSNDQKLGITGPPSYNKAKLKQSDFNSGITINLIYP